MSAPARVVVVWCVILILDDVSSLVLAHFHGENLWLQYPTVPLESCTALWALSAWQPHEVLRLAYRLAIPALLLLAAVVLAMPFRALAFDQVVAPLCALVLLVAALHTLVHRSLIAEQSVTQEEWFWISLGMSLMFSTAVAIRPFAQAFELRRDLVAYAYIAKGWMDILAFLLITRGILVRTEPKPR